MTLTTGHRVRKTSRRMADGREIIYFDDTEPYLSGAAVREAVDTRPLPPAEQVVRGGSQVRYDPLTGEWIAMASHRNDRTFMPPADEDPLAPTRPGGFPTEVAEADYDVVVFENRFPAFSPRIGGEAGLVDGEALWPVRPANGRTEVVCFSPAREGSFGSLSPRRARTVIEAWADRTAELGRLPGVEHVFVFENRGREIPGPEPLPYISGVHQAPVRTGRDLFRLHLQVFSVLRGPGRLKYLAGAESAMGAWISDAVPERIAARLREIAP